MRGERREERGETGGEWVLMWFHVIVTPVYAFVNFVDKKSIFDLRNKL